MGNVLEKQVEIICYSANAVCKTYNGFTEKEIETL